MLEAGNLRHCWLCLWEPKHTVCSRLYFCFPCVHCVSITVHVIIIITWRRCFILCRVLFALNSVCPHRPSDFDAHSFGTHVNHARISERWHGISFWAVVVTHLGVVHGFVLNTFIIVHRGVCESVVLWTLDSASVTHCWNAAYNAQIDQLKARKCSNWFEI